MYGLLAGIAYSKRDVVVAVKNGHCHFTGGVKEAWFGAYFFFVRAVIEVLSILVYIAVVVVMVC